MFKVQTARFWSGTQERCLHNSCRQMKGTFQTAPLSIRHLWSVPASHKIPNKKKVEKILHRDSQRGKVDVCISHFSMWFFSQNPAAGVLFMSQMRSKRKNSAGGRILNTLVERLSIFQKYLDDCVEQWFAHYETFFTWRIKRREAENLICKMFPHLCLNVRGFFWEKKKAKHFHL